MLSPLLKAPLTLVLICLVVGCADPDLDAPPKRSLPPTSTPDAQADLPTQPPPKPNLCGQGKTLEELRQDIGVWARSPDKLEPYDRAACTPSWLRDGVAIARQYSSVGPRPNGKILSVEFFNGDPVSVNGMACVPEINQGFDQSASFDDCNRRFICGCCVFTFDTYLAPGKTADEVNYQVEALTSEQAQPDQIAYCQGILERGRYEIETPTPYTATSGSGGVGSSKCQTCLKQCRDLNVPNCCTGSGCLCQQECTATSCASGYKRCCGSDGYCFCAKQDSPFSCPW